MNPDEPVVPEPDAYYPGHQHAAMKRMVDENRNPRTAHQIIGIWRTLGAELTRISAELDAVATELPRGWTGAAADPLREALRELAEFTGRTSMNFEVIANIVEVESDAAALAGATMPDSLDDDTIETLRESALGANPLDHVAAADLASGHERRLEALAEAVRVMEARDNTMRAAIGNMPLLEPPPDLGDKPGS